MEVDETVPSQVLPSPLEPVNNESGLPQGPTLPTEVNVTAVDDQQELGHEEEAESSHAGDRAGHGTGDAELVEPSMRDVLDAVKTMGTQMLALTQAFTPLVNSSVGQVTPAQTAVQAARATAQAAQTTARVAQTAARAAGTAARTVEGRATAEAEVMEIDPPVRTARKEDYLSVLAHISKLGTKQVAGSVDPIEADEWRSRLTRNFTQLAVQMSTRKTLQFTSWKGTHTTGGWLWINAPTVPLRGSQTLRLSSTTSTFQRRLRIVWNRSSWT